MKHPRVLLVEDDAQLRASLNRLLRLSGYEVVGHDSAESLITTLTDTAAAQSVACILMDVNLPALSGIEAQKVLRSRFPAVPIIFISAELNAHHVNQAWREGATEFLFKPFAPEQLMDALERVLARSVPSGPGALSFDEGGQAQQAQAALIRSLTSRQLQVLRALVQGHSNTKIGQTLQISPRTVKMHREAVMHRLGVRHLAELVSYYEQHKALFVKLHTPSTPGATEAA